MPAPPARTLLSKNKNVGCNEKNIGYNEKSTVEQIIVHSNAMPQVTNLLYMAETSMKLLNPEVSA